MALSFKEKLQYLIDVKKISQVDVAKGLGVGEARVSLWLKGNVNTPRRSTLQNIAEFFECNISWLADGTGEPFPTPKTETNEYSGEFDRRKANRETKASIARLERVLFKSHCPAYFDSVFDFVAEKYGQNKEGVEAFIADLLKSNPKFKDWDEKKRAEGDDSLSPRKYAQNEQ